MFPLIAFALLMAPQEFNPANDRERSTGDSFRTRQSQWNPDPDPKLSTLGPRIIRFSVFPALRGGDGNVITVWPGPHDEAVAAVRSIRHRCDASWKNCRTISQRSPAFAFCLQNDCSYSRLAKQIRALLFDPNRMPKPNDGEICTDGPGYSTEFREEGATYNLSGFCAANHPNNLIARWMLEGAGTRWKAMGED